MAYRSAREVLRAVLNQTRPKLPYILKHLKDAGIEPIMAEYKNAAGKAVGDPLLSTETFEAFTKYLTAWKATQAVPKLRRTKDKPQEAVALSGVLPMAELAEWRASLEEVILEQEARIDSLHKAVEAISTVYSRLLKEVDPKAQLPAPPILPPKYKHKTLIAGLDAPSITRLQDNFRTAKLVHVGDSRNNKPPSNKLGAFDLILCMTSYCGHALRNSLEARYGKNTINYVKDSQSSAESVLALWLHEKEDKNASADHR